MYFFEIKLPNPDLEEQKKITDFFISIDKKIESVGNKLEEMKIFKKGLLQKMFV